MSSTDEPPALPQDDGDVHEKPDHRDPAFELEVMERHLKDMKEKKDRLDVSTLRDGVSKEELAELSQLELDIRHLETKIAKENKKMQSEAIRIKKEKERRQKEIEYFRQAATIDLLKSRTDKLMHQYELSSRYAIFDVLDNAFTQVLQLAPLPIPFLTVADLGHGGGHPLVRRGFGS